MCGVAGFFLSAIAGHDPAPVLAGMLARLAHRGPDGSGGFLDQAVALGATRLAIVDPAGGAQPMRDPSGRYVLVYNGEVYNHRELRRELTGEGCRFATRSDTEVVVQALAHWGPACLSRFNGPFALALWDGLARRLILARDRFGQRPLYYISGADGQTGLAFASEVKALCAIPGLSLAFDVETLAGIFATWTPLDDQCCFAGVRQVPMGCYMSVQQGETELRRFATVDLSPCPAEGELAEVIRTRLERSVARRLRADVPAGVYLSGGIDSSIVASIAARQAGEVLQTFSVEFDDTSFDESEHQRTVAAQLGARHRPLRVSDRDLVEAFPAAVLYAETPSFRTAFVPMYLLSRHARAHGVKVVLTGEGADEVFFGYSIFRDTALRAAWTTLTSEAKRERLARLHPYLGHFGPGHTTELLGLYQRYSIERMPGLFSHEMRFQAGRFAVRLLAGAPDPFAALQDRVAQHQGFARLDPVRRAQWLELETLLPGYLLSTQGDRMSMAHGVENRCPFLDPEVVELGRSIDLGQGAEQEIEKATLRAAFERSLPPQILRRRKQPYRAPGVAAFQRHRPDYLEAVLSQRELARVAPLDARFASRLAAKVLASPLDRIGTQEDQAFCLLLSTALLHRHFVEPQPQARRELPHLVAGSRAW